MPLAFAFGLRRKGLLFPMSDTWHADLCKKCHEIFHTWLRSSGRTAWRVEAGVLGSFCRVSTRAVIWCLNQPLVAVPPVPKPLPAPKPILPAYDGMEVPMPVREPKRPVHTKIHAGELQRLCLDNPVLRDAARTMNRPAFRKFLRRHFKHSPIRSRMISNALLVLMPGKEQKDQRRAADRL